MRSAVYDLVVVRPEENSFGGNLRYRPYLVSITWVASTNDVGVILVRVANDSDSVPNTILLVAIGWRDALRSTCWSLVW